MRPLFLCVDSEFARSSPVVLEVISRKAVFFVWHRDLWYEVERMREET